MKAIIVSLLLFIGFECLATDPLIESFKYHRDKSQLDSCHKICEALILKYPKEDEYKIWHAQVNAWKGQFKQAIKELHLIRPNSYNYFLLASFHYWDKNYDSAHNHIIKSISLDSNNKEAIQLETKIQFLREEYKECINLINKYKLDTISNFKPILNQCYNKVRNKKVCIGHGILQQEGGFNQSSFAGFQLSKRRFTTISTFTNLHSQNAFLVQQEIYTNTKKLGYQYYSIRLASKNFHTPLSLSFVEFYQYRKTEIDLGIRWYKSQLGNSLWVPSFGITRHIERLSLSYRYYMSRGINLKGSTQSISVKRLINKNDNFVRLDFSIGAQQDLYNQGLLELSRSNQSMSINLNGTFNISPRASLSFIGGYSRNSLEKVIVLNSLQLVAQINYKF